MTPCCGDRWVRSCRWRRYISVSTRSRNVAAAGAPSQEQRQRGKQRSHTGYDAAGCGSGESMASWLLECECGWRRVPEQRCCLRGGGTTAGACGHPALVTWPSTLHRRLSPTRLSTRRSVQYHCQENQRRSLDGGRDQHGAEAGGVVDKQLRPRVAAEDRVLDAGPELPTCRSAGHPSRTNWAQMWAPLAAAPRRRRYAARRGTPQSCR
jgi:hypothetical protein